MGRGVVTKKKGEKKARRWKNKEPEKTKRSSYSPTADWPPIAKKRTVPHPGRPDE